MIVFLEQHKRVACHFIKKRKSSGGGWKKMRYGKVNT
jgi:hypothetical protein